jgi:hypothetical protein
MPRFVIRNEDANEDEGNTRPHSAQSQEQRIDDQKLSTSSKSDSPDPKGPESEGNTATPAEAQNISDNNVNVTASSRNLGPSHLEPVNIHQRSQSTSDADRVREPNVIFGKLFDAVPADGQAVRCVQLQVQSKILF